jgi:hypothetical protein
MTTRGVPVQRVRRLSLAALCAGGLIVPTSALAAKRPGPPAAGVWASGPHQGFVVAKNRKSVSGVSVSLKSCGKRNLGIARVLGTQKISTLKVGGYTNWVIGRPDHGGRVHGLTVRLKVGKQVKLGALSFIWNVNQQIGNDYGQLAIRGCTVTFHAHHK